LLLYVEFAFLDCFFDGFLYQLGVPFIVEGLFSPDDRLNLDFHLVMAGFTDITMGHVEVITSRYRGFDDILANITGKGFHIILLAFILLVNDCCLNSSRKSIINKENTTIILEKSRGGKG